ncbi:Small ribosomal subunit biogenesis GTPase RsgA [Arenibacter antarcticus]|uniref:tRNA threonylcarbamoyladenosine biosynthesis protein TsaE n=1 Tax=Arenibacter antarcticus TaxID=2040469 RepID=A0ABW5VH93_9FLAO|nr:tRNA (adenosine(37)-N6)-threonylcarbamoyltransferase complex ATPase subunit type 1 TsaE [Arenibacter sp. H213]MCM4166228.1 tRNA (adenosine(37)-N6)-threonylcarbamoyltransferase complex ATPase subunit type 1 TsaE [Arenibacter sp. H213]
MSNTYTQAQIHDAVQHILNESHSKILCFHGDMGAGKTTLIKALVKELGGGNVSSSPTFGIVNEYYYQNEELLGYHFDFYRLEDETEALDIGLEDYLYSNTWVFMEWPEKIPSLIPSNATHIYISIIDEKTRSLVLSQNPLQ